LAICYASCLRRPEARTARWRREYIPAITESGGTPIKRAFYFVVLLLAFGWSRADDQVVAEPEADQVTKGFSTGTLYVSRAHTCSDSGLLADCLTPLKVVDDPALFYTWRSPSLQSYGIYLLVTDIAGTFVYLEFWVLPSTDPGNCGACFISVRSRRSAVASLPAGDYKFQVIVIGQGTVQRAISDPYIFHAN
jgi:hypothetical protein